MAELVRVGRRVFNIDQLVIADLDANAEHDVVLRLAGGEVVTLAGPEAEFLREVVLSEAVSVERLDGTESEVRGVSGLWTP